MTHDVISWEIFRSSRQDLEQFYLCRRHDELVRTSEAKLSEMYEKMLKERQDLADATS